MIPDFKTYLRESVWSDMQDRGTGDLEKKEDNIDNLTFEEFYDYLKSHYTYIGPGRQKNIEYYKRSSSSCILFPVLLVKWGFIAIDYEEFGDKKYTIRPDNDLINNNPDLYAKLKKRYVIKNKKSIIDQTYFSIEPVKGDIDYKFIIEVIDYILSLFEYPTFKKVNESVWSDMQDRGTGEMVKKEDDIDNMDVDEFYNYLTEHYSLSEGEFDWITTDYDGEPVYEIWIPITRPKNSKVGVDSYFIVYQYYDMCLTIANNFSIDFPELGKLIDDNFVMKEHPKYNDDLLYIGEKEKVTYSFVVKVINFIIDNIQDKRELIINKI